MAPTMIFSLILFLFSATLCAQGKLVINDWDIENDEPMRGEITGDIYRDLKFDLQLSSQVDRPPKKKKLPRAEEVQRYYEQQKRRLWAEAAEANDDLLHNVTVTVQKGFQFYDLFDLKKHQLKCCPLSQNYQCRSTDVVLPCFYGYYDGAWEWCCPFWPSKVYFKRCNCCQCYILTSTFIYQGKCQQRYYKRSFLAVCYRKKLWATLRYVTKYLPSSCYCNIK